MLLTKRVVKTLVMFIFVFIDRGAVSKHAKETEANTSAFWVKRIFYPISERIPSFYWSGNMALKAWQFRVLKVAVVCKTGLLARADISAIQNLQNVPK